MRIRVRSSTFARPINEKISACCLGCFKHFALNVFELSDLGGINDDNPSRPPIESVVRPCWKYASEICLGWATNRGIFYQLRHPKHSFTAIEAVNRGLSTFNFFLTFSEFQIFNENVVYYCDFVHCLNFSDFWKGGGLWKSVKIKKLTKIKEEVLIYSIQGGQPWPFRAWGTHIRLLKNSRLLDLCPTA